MTPIISILLATLVVSLFSLTGIYALTLKEGVLHRILFVLIGLSSGTIMGAVFFDLLGEAMELVEGDYALIYISLGFVLFFFLERFIYWYHGHGHSEDIEHLPVKPGRQNTNEFAYLNLVGDAIHNYIDGLIIAASFLVNTSVGIATTVAIIFHELPQEMGDYGILIYSGFTKKMALILNFLVALTVVFGGISAVFLTEYIEALSGLLVAVAAGGFMYLGASELIPELHKETDLKRSIIQFMTFIIGLLLIYGLGIIFPE